MISIHGIGWMTENKFGIAHHDFSGEYQSHKDFYFLLKEKEILRSSLKNFGRFNAVSKKTCLAVALALYDAGIDSSRYNMQDVGVVSTNKESCLQANINYFKDYVDCGRKLSRGSLFVYTLPSTPIAEAAINFGCQGSVSYLAFKEKPTESILDQGRMMIEQKTAKELLIINADEKEAICFYCKEQDAENINNCISLDEMQSLIKGSCGLSDIIEKISQKGDK